MTTSNQLRLDPLTGRWIAVSTSRANRPTAFTPRMKITNSDSATCPFCPGNEEETPAALETYGANGKWLIRVLPNLYPAFDGDEPFIVSHLGPVFTEAPSSGIHEVLILSPSHAEDFGQISDEQCSLVMSAIRDRTEEHCTTPGLRYTQAIINHGREAGASIEHPHAQLLGIPFVPRELADEQAGFARFAGGCLLCTTLDAENRAKHRIVSSNEYSAVISPYWAGHPYEMLIIPKKHGQHMHKSNQVSLYEIGLSIKDAILRLINLLGDVSYNLVFHSAPYRASGTYHWHIHLIPKLTTRAGFELGTGVMINIVSPESAAEQLREAKSQ